MNDLIYAPVVAAILLGLAADFQDLGEDTTEKTARYAQDAVNALDCAYQARPLTECSPDLFNTEFTEEIERTNELLERTQEAPEA